QKKKKKKRTRNLTEVLSQKVQRTQKKKNNMKFTESPVIDLPIRDKTLSLQQDNGSMHVGTSVWPCSLVLAKFIERWAPPAAATTTNNNPYSALLDFHTPCRRRGIELGAGCGAAGMAFHLLGLTDLVLTDIAPVMPALKHNLKRNKQTLGKMLKTSVLYWNNRDQIGALMPAGAPFDLVVAADVVYIEESVGHLVAAMETLVADDGAVLLGYQQLTNDCFSDIISILDGRGANISIPTLCSVKPSSLTGGSCPVKDVVNFEKAVYTSKLLEACSIIDHLKGCCRPICQSAVMEAALHISVTQLAINENKDSSSFSIFYSLPLF
ncbi:hypothetical protein Tsubulata_041901, partial [Turnera subulata]